MMLNLTCFGIGRGKAHALLKIIPSACMGEGGNINYK